MDSEFTVIAIGTWYYDQAVQKRLKLLRQPSTHARSRWVEDAAGNFLIDEKLPVPVTPDGMVYYIDATQGGEFPTAADAAAWAETQPWGPIAWKFCEAPDGPKT